MNTFWNWKQAPKADFAVVGSPISHSLSPVMQTRALRILGREENYVAVEIPVGEFDEALDYLTTLGYKGVNVTIPHKKSAYLWCKNHDQVAAKLNVVNTIRLEDRFGINTDVPGFLATLKGVHFRHKKALVLGAGGSSRAIVYGLHTDGWRLSLWNRTQGRAEDLLHELGISAELVGNPSAEGFDLIVNSTATGTTGGEIDLDFSRAKGDCIVYDLAYTSGPTRFLREAFEAGLSIMDGRQMLVEQGALSLEFWISESAPRLDMYRAISR
jgi:shikimate dehydrogenase